MRKGISLNWIFVPLAALWIMSGCAHDVTPVEDVAVVDTADSEEQVAGIDLESGEEVAAATVPPAPAEPKPPVATNEEKRPKPPRRIAKAPASAPVAAPVPEVASLDADAASAEVVEYGEYEEAETEAEESPVVVAPAPPRIEQASVGVGGFMRSHAKLMIVLAGSALLITAAFLFWSRRSPGDTLRGPFA